MAALKASLTSSKMKGVVLSHYYTHLNTKEKQSITWHKDQQDCDVAPPVYF